MNILAHTSFIGNTGYANHARSFFTALNKYHTVKVRNLTIGDSWKGMSDTPHDNESYITDEMKDMLILQTLFNPDKTRTDHPMYGYKGDFKADIHIILEEVNNYYYYDNYDGYKIGFCVYESTRFPDEFFNRLLSYDEMWVPTQWQFNSLVEQGYPIEKIRIVPEGVDTEVFHPEDMLQPDKFRFLLFGRWDYRKSTTEIIRTFGETFKDNKNVELICSVENPYPYDGLKTTEERIKKYGLKYDNIKYLKFPNREDYVYYLKSGDVFLSCARSEGWNLPLIEAMSCGTPSIYSNWGGQLQFAGGKGIPVKISKLRPANIFDKEVEGEYCEPDFADLSAQMINVYENYDKYKMAALKEAEEIHKEFNWDKIAKIADKILNEKNDENFSDDVFIVGEYANTPVKEMALVSLIQNLKQFNIPIILSGHHYVSPETQKMVDFFIFDRDNPIEYDNFNKKYWAETNRWRIDANLMVHDYAVWTTIRNGIIIANYMGKKNIHYIDYDCDPDFSKYKNEFLTPIKHSDASVMTHHTEIKDYDSYVFSMKTDVGLKLFNSIKTKEEYFRVNSSDFILEHVFYKKLHEITNNIHISKYRVPSLYSAGTDSKVRSLLLCDERGKLFYYFITDSGTKSFTTVIDYDGSEKEYTVENGVDFNNYIDGKLFDSHTGFILEIGDYKTNEIVRAYHKNDLISNITLKQSMNEYRSLNSIKFKTT
jgi:glycosyltransferase involved in cell wall biosynthesis